MFGVGNHKESALWKGSMYVIALIFLLMLIFPYLYILLSSFKPSSEVISTTPTFLPSVFSIENYQTLISQMSIGKFFMNSIIAALISTIICLILGSMASYAISRTPMAKLSNFFLILVLCLKMIPMASIA